MWLNTRTVAKTFGEAFRAAMDAAKVEPLELAKKSGVQASTISKWRSTSAIPRPDSLAPVLKVLQISLPELLDGVITPWGMPLCGHPDAKARDHPASGHHRGGKRSAG